ncbi:hypothetical protein KX728_02705 [Streptococcus oralis]|uniref:hypothetical protein n=1 Tax=Streptococcus oralis TaxID=1303 RepID=UPI001C051A90|nr:hypothetical protein [Streptococcus oralis]MBU0454688.1 hypothetical protein [Streptococcus oralis]MBZ2093772.1 hypothetical protein [Streptococcus oralis]MBZ2098752.1 hypothetical protein [Streptococcus oralis]QXW61893.1 hypothetical protein KX728_02705 [Streptococcus oralis]
MKLYLKGNYETSIYQDCMEYPWKMWFKECKGVEVGFSYARDDDFYFSVSLDKFSSNDERWGVTDFKIGDNPWNSFKYEYLILDFENSYESDGREKGDYLRIISTHLDILTVDKRAMYIMAIEVASAIGGQISEDDKETWLDVETFKELHKDVLSLTYDEAVEISLEELKTMVPVREPLWDEEERLREEYIRIHGERVYDDEEDE